MPKQDYELNDLSAYMSQRLSRSPADNLDDNYHGHDFHNVDFELAPPNNGVSTPAWFESRPDSKWGSRLTLFLSKAWRGPDEIRDYASQPIQSLLAFEELPRKLKSRLTTRQQLLILIAYLGLWFLLWTKTLLPYLVEIPQDSDGSQVIPLTCGQADLFWKGKNANCGLDAKDCPSFELQDDVTFRCPALCDRGSWLYSLRAVGDEIVKYRGYFIGGGVRKDGDSILSYPYRADSFPCGAAVHSGIVSPFFGGCARVSFSSGVQTKYKPTRGHYGVSDSIGFSSVFPFSYVFKLISATPTHCYDPRLLVLLMNIVLGAPLVYLTPGVVVFWVMAIVGFWTIVTATDPPVLVDPYHPETFYELISLGLERFLPTCFIVYVLWTVSVKRTFSLHFSDYSRPSLEETLYESSRGNFSSRGDSPLTRLFLWYPLFWLGVLNNITFDRLPVDRLTWHDLQVQPGALLTVAIVVVLLLCCIGVQGYNVWLSGRFWKLLLVYGGMMGGLYLLSTLPGLTLRLHHYIFGLVFIPGCSTRGRVAHAFQGILLGLFLSGVARWGYASIAETNLSLLRGEPLGQLASPEILGFDSGLLYWQSSHNTTVVPSIDLAARETFTVSLLVNDIERFRGKSNGTIDVASLLHRNDDLKLFVDLGTDVDEFPLYLRLALFLQDEDTFGDYTRAAVLKVPSFELELPPPGIT